jgi:hypothetical protein
MELISENSSGVAKIIHSRNKDTKNYFSYKAPYLFLNLKNKSQLSKIFSYNKFNIFSISNLDHGYRDKNKSLLCFVEDMANKFSIKYSDILFMSIPRILGYAFNPISFYIYLDKEGSLVAIIYEVKNTFGDQIHYLDMGNFSNKSFKKNMYVSPFIEMDCRYEISFEAKLKHHLLCKIQQYDNSEKSIFFASLEIGLKPLTKDGLIRFFLNNFYGSFKVILLIHYQAVKLFFKKSKFYQHMKNPKNEVNVE